MYVARNLSQEWRNLNKHWRGVSTFLDSHVIPLQTGSWKPLVLHFANVLCPPPWPERDLGRVICSTNQGSLDSPLQPSAGDPLGDVGSPSLHCKGLRPCWSSSSVSATEADRPWAVWSGACSYWCDHSLRSRGKTLREAQNPSEEWECTGSNSSGGANFQNPRPLKSRTRELDKPAMSLQIKIHATL